MNKVKRIRQVGTKLEFRCPLCDQYKTAEHFSIRERFDKTGKATREPASYCRICFSQYNKERRA